jgi:hypothetical protein
VAAAALLLPGLATAQRPFDVLDPFYQEETARRTFYDGFALSGQVNYQGAGPLGQASEAERPGPFGLAFRLDYALVPQVDVSAVFDVSGGLVSQLGGGPVRLSWVVVKPYWHNESTDYAVRIAVDPASEGGLGFRQTDIAFVSTSNFSLFVSSDFAIGLRQARVGYERLQVGEDDGTLGPDLASADPEFVRTRAIGKEVHAMWGLNFHFDPAGSNVFVTALGEAMDYDLVTTRPFDAARGGELGEEGAEEPEQRSYRGGVGWLRFGVEFSRPGYQVSPSVGLPFVTWVDATDEGGTWGPRLQSLRLGLRLTIR